MEGVIIRPMTRDTLLWQCLHHGTLAHTHLHTPCHTEGPAVARRGTTEPLLDKLVRTYGTCALLAWHGDYVVGFLRFHPKVIAELPAAGQMCLLQDFPNGPSPELTAARFPPLQEIADKTLVVGCLMTGSPEHVHNPYQRRGLGTRLAQALIEWAVDHGWEAIEAVAYMDLPLVFQTTGDAGRKWWERLGFEVIATEVEQAMLGLDDFLQTARAQATELGLDPDTVTQRYTMRLELGGRG